MEFPIEILQDQVELMVDELMYAEGEEREELKKRLDETNKALMVLKNF